jgi:DNA repair protein RecO (recombination protein O)
MSGERVVLQPAYVLHRRAYRETSLLVETFTAGYGRVGMVAKGAKRGRWQAVLQPFQPLLLSWSGRGELRTLTGAEPQGPVPMVAGRSLFTGFYLNELLLKLLPREDSHPELFARYSESLGMLSVDEEWSLRLFERDLLRGLGYGLSLDYDASGEPLDSDRLYHYEAEQGAVPVNRPVAGQLAVHGCSLLALGEHAEADERARRETKRLLRAILGIYLNGRILESRALYRSVLGQAGSDEEEK